MNRIVKLQHQDDIQKLDVPLSKISTFVSLKNWIAEIYGLNLEKQSLWLKYKDEDSDLVNLKNEDDLLFALAQAKLFIYVFYEKNQRVYVKNDFNTSHDTPQEQEKSFNYFMNIGAQKFHTLLNQGAGGPSCGAVVRITIEMFDDGFTVDDGICTGSFRSYSDPANVAFMDSLKRRETPPEFLKKYAGRPIDVVGIKKPGKYVFKPFSGMGYMLRPVIPNVNLSCINHKLISDTSASTTDQMQTRAQTYITLNVGEPSTCIKFRLPNGRHITGRFSPFMKIDDHH